MFKFFRKYNKVILVVGGCVLMIAFLIPQAVQMFAPNSQNATIGRAHGEKLTAGDQFNAGAELSLLGRLPFREGLFTDDGLTWLLIQRDAEALGLYASDREVELALQTVGIDNERLLQIAKDTRTTTATIQEVVRNWLIAEQYRQLVTGTAYRDPRGNSASPAIERLQVFNETANRIISRQLQGLENLPPEMLQQIAPRVYQEAGFMAGLQANGTHRLSGPMLTHYVQENYPTVEGRAVLILPDADAVDEPTEAQLAEVFEAYKDALPGAGEPFPFGYRYPDRVKLEYLRVPIAAVRDAVQVDYVEVLDAYEANRAAFAGTEGEAPEMPSAEAVAALSEQLKSQKAQQLASRVMARVQGLLAEDVRGYAQDAGYVTLPDDFAPVDLNQIVEDVRSEFAVELDVLGEPDTWVATRELRGLEGIGFSVIGDGNGVPFETYVAYTRKLETPDNPTPRSLRSQLDVASKPLRDQEGNLYVFRLHEAEASHVPAGLDEVRPQVVADAKTRAAYERLVAEAESWRTLALNEGIEAAAEAADAGVSQTFGFPKVADNQGNPPNVLGVGVSRPFVDAAFGLVESIEPGAEIETLPMAQRLVVTPLTATQQGPALALFVLDGYQPLTRSGFELAVSTDDALIRTNLSVNRDLTASPMGIEAIAQRVGFDLAAMDN